MAAVTLHCGDCLEVMPRAIADKSIDMVLCDLPYGITRNAWDSMIPLDKLWCEYKRVVKDDGVIALFGNNPFSAKLILSNEKMFRYSLVWEKNKFSDFLNAKRKPMKIHEDILVFYQKQPTYNPQYVMGGEPYRRWNAQSAVDKQTNYGAHKANVAESADGRRLPTTVLKFDRVERPDHPTQKPVALLEWLVRTYTDEGQVVLDNTMGVGSTGVACLAANRRFVGIEKDPKYFEKAQKKLLAVGD